MFAQLPFPLSRIKVFSGGKTSAIHSLMAQRWLGALCKHFKHTLTVGAGKLKNKAKEARLKRHRSFNTCWMERKNKTKSNLICIAFLLKSHSPCLFKYICWCLDKILKYIMQNSVFPMHKQEACPFLLLLFRKCSERDIPVMLILGSPGVSSAVCICLPPNMWQAQQRICRVFFLQNAAKSRALNVLLFSFWRITRLSLHGWRSVTGCNMAEAELDGK